MLRVTVRATFGPRAYRLDGHRERLGSDSVRWTLYYDYRSEGTTDD